MMHRRVLIVTLTALIAASVLAQTPSDRLAFEAASIKPNRTADVAVGNIGRPGGHLAITNHSVRMLLGMAFSMDLNRARQQVFGLPGWADSDRYDIQAEAPGNPTPDDKKAMLLALLGERFKLAFHHETRPQSVFVVALVTSGKMGPQLRPHIDDSSCDQSASTDSTSINTMSPMPPEQAVWAAVQQLPCGRLGEGLLEGRREQAWAGGRRIMLDLFAERLGGMMPLDRPVQANRIGLSGTFDLALLYNPQIQDLAGSSPDAAGLSFTQALREQLGLKLDPQTVPTDVVVVDHIERPKED